MPCSLSSLLVRIYDWQQRPSRHFPFPALSLPLPPRLTSLLSSRRLLQLRLVPPPLSLPRTTPLELLQHLSTKSRPRARIVQRNPPRPPISQGAGYSWSRSRRRRTGGREAGKDGDGRKCAGGSSRRAGGARSTMAGGRASREAREGGSSHKSRGMESFAIRDHAFSRRTDVPFHAFARLLLPLTLLSAPSLSPPFDCTLHTLFRLPTALHTNSIDQGREARERVARVRRPRLSRTKEELSVHHVAREFSERGDAEYADGRSWGGSGG